MRIIDHKALDRLTAEAQNNPRRRKNLNIHPSDDHCCHRLFNAVEPDSYIRPHRHPDPVKAETFVIIRGRLGIIVFDSDGAVVEKVLLTPGGETIAVDVPPGTFHTAVALSPGTIFFESKAGPYLPLTEKDFAAWAPNDNTPEGAAYLGHLRSLFL